MGFIISVILIFITVAFVTCQLNVEYAGTTEGAQALLQVNVSNGTCTTTGIYAPYVVFNTTFHTSGVREISAVADRKLKSSLSIYIYTFLDAEFPCDNLVNIVKPNQYNFGDGPVLDDFIYFESQTYYFAVTSSSFNISGVFAVNIFESTAVGNTNAESPTWPLVYTTTFYTPLCQAVHVENAPYAIYSWTQNTTSWFDLSAYFVNESIIWYSTNLALYEGIPVLLTHPCNASATNATFIAASKLVSRGALIPYQNLTSGITYSVVLSGDSNETYGYWGFQITPTRVRFENTNSPYIQPNRAIPCSIGQNVVQAWDSTFFTASYRTYLIDTGYPPEPFTRFDTFSFLYSGNNTGNGPLGIAPTSCSSLTPLLAANDTGTDAIARLLDQGSNYTIVVSTFNTAGLEPLTPPQQYAYMLYVFTGESIGNVPTSGTTTTTITTTTSSSVSSSSSTTKSSTSSSTSTANGSTLTSTTTATSKGRKNLPSLLSIISTFLVFHLYM